uniref:ATPase phospholipid transporting 8B3 n=1 Tax=Chelonoidis abingdonii TaxID=106734 RepID=A0A8C0G3C0_CHEAB
MAQRLAAFPDFTWEVKANDRAYHKQFKKRDNTIKTAKYNALTFLPLNLYEQFHRLANLYFLFVILLQVRSRWRSGGDCWACQASALRWAQRGERHCLKTELWGLISKVSLRPFLFRLLLKADLLLLSSSEPSSLCYVETADIDGQGVIQTIFAVGIPGKVTCEEPNSRMHSFIGTLEWRGEKYSLDTEKILLRGCRIRNTETCYGLVIYAGECQRHMWPSALSCPHPAQPQEEAGMKIIIIGNIPISWNWKGPRKVIKSTFFTFWGFMILLSIIVPMSMYITFEFVYMVNSYFIDWDLEMYYPAKDMPAKARSTSLNDQLGQIEYIFSDKTGTLTQNIMTFKKCCINGIIYGTSEWKTQTKQKTSTNQTKRPLFLIQLKKIQFHDPALLETVLQNDDPVVREFLRLLALCHTVMVEEKDSELAGQLVYQAASPDEEALVTAARNLGYVFLSRTQDTITLSELGMERTYSMLAMLDFNSVRKRMSILVRDPEGKIRLYTKGADMLILERLREDGPATTCLLYPCLSPLQSFAEETLRTLCLASKEVKEEDYAEWSKKHHEASVLLQNRAQELDKVYEEIEQDLQVGSGSPRAGNLVGARYRWEEAGFRAGLVWLLQSLISGVTPWVLMVSQFASIGLREKGLPCSVLTCWNAAEGQVLGTRALEIRLLLGVSSWALKTH